MVFSTVACGGVRPQARKSSGESNPWLARNSGVSFAELGVTHKKRHYGRTTVSPIHVFTTLYEIAANWAELREKR